MNIYHPRDRKYLAPFKKQTAELLSLSPEQAQRRFDHLVALYADNDGFHDAAHESAYEELIALLTLKSSDPASYFKAYLASSDVSFFYEVCFERNEFFHNASEEVAAELARLAEAGVHGPASALAQTGGAEALRYFTRQAAGAHADRVQSTLWEGGRELDGGAFRLLRHDECYPIVFDAAPDSPLRVTKPSGETCACGCQIIDFLTLDLDDPRLAFLGGKGTLRFRFCFSCLVTNYFELYFRVGSDGSCVPYEELDREPGRDFSEEEMAEFAANTLGMAASPVHPAYAYATGYLNDGFGLSAIGGMPGWVQEPEYLPCPHCGKTMTFIAQLAYSLIPGEDDLAIMYFHLCKECGVAGVNTQQT